MRNKEIKVSIKKPRKKAVYIEEMEQKALFERARLQESTRDLFAIPNAGKRGWVQAKNMKKSGLTSGIPDVCLPRPSPNGYHALYIELKPNDKREATDNQLAVIERFKQLGNYACICYGWEHAWEIINKYLKGEL